MASSKKGLPSDPDAPGLPGIPASEKKPRARRAKPSADPFSPELNQEIEQVAATAKLDAGFIRSLIGEHIDKTVLGHVAQIASEAVAARLGKTAETSAGGPSPL